MGNITNEPMFVDTNTANYRLQLDSPCINTGTNQDWMIGATDMDGNPRIRRGRVDMGAYESDYWGMYADQDNDGMSDYNEVMIAGTDATDPASCLLVNIGQAETNVLVSWSNTGSRIYHLWFSPDLVTGLWQSVGAYTNLPLGTTCFTNVIATNAAFFRVTVVNTNL
jgi:hypothetical protein